MHFGSVAHLQDSKLPIDHTSSNRQTKTGMAGSHAPQTAQVVNSRFLSFHVFLAGWGILILSFLAVFPVNIDECFMDRKLNPYSKKQAWLHPNTILNAMIAAAIAAMVFLVIRGRGNRRSVLIDCLATVLWYQSSYGVLWTLKFVLNDRTCSEFANSVSGHYNLYIFAGISLFFLAVKSRRNAWQLEHYVNRKLLRHMSMFKLTLSAYCVIACALTFAFLAVLSSWRTWTYGYHSLRQIAYGSLFAIVNLSVWSFVIGSHYSQSSSARFWVVAHASIFALCSVIFKLVIAPIQLWDHYLLILALTVGMIVVYRYVELLPFSSLHSVQRRA